MIRASSDQGQPGRGQSVFANALSFFMVILSSEGFTFRNKPGPAHCYATLTSWGGPSVRYVLDGRRIVPVIFCAEHDQFEITLEST